MELIILVAIEPCVDLPFAMFVILFWCGLIPGIWLLVFQPGGGTQLIDIAGFLRSWYVPYSLQTLFVGCML